MVYYEPKQANIVYQEDLMLAAGFAFWVLLGLIFSCVGAILGLGPTASIAAGVVIPPVLSAVVMQRHRATNH